MSLLACPPTAVLGALRRTLVRTPGEFCLQDSRRVGALRSTSVMLQLWVNCPGEGME